MTKVGGRDESSAEGSRARGHQLQQEEGGLAAGPQQRPPHGRPAERRGFRRFWVPPDPKLERVRLRLAAGPRASLLQARREGGITVQKIVRGSRESSGDIRTFYLLRTCRNRNCALPVCR